MPKALPVALAGMLLALTACSPAAGGTPAPIEITAEVGTVVPVEGTLPPAGTPPTPAPATPLPTLSAGATPTELKYVVLAQYPDLFFCDPDYYPVAREDEAELARQRFPELQANTEEFQAILKHTGLSGQTTFSDDDKLLIYREHKRLAAVAFEAQGDQYHFQLQIETSAGEGFVITGVIDGQGALTETQRDPSVPTCPICLAAGTLIDTPHGSVAVIDLQVDDLVWTLDANGARVSAPIVSLVRVPVPAQHVMVHLRLADGREVWASPGHPTTDGRALAELHPGDRLDGSRIIQAERVPYDQPATYDLLPAGDTGFYWANGVLLASTLAK